MTNPLYEDMLARVWDLWSLLPSFSRMCDSGIDRFEHDARIPLVKILYKENWLVVKEDLEGYYSVIIEYKGHKTYLKEKGSVTEAIENLLEIEFVEEYVGLGI